MTCVKNMLELRGFAINWRTARRPELRPSGGHPIAARTESAMITIANDRIAVIFDTAERPDRGTPPTGVHPNSGRG